MTSFVIRAKRPSLREFLSEMWAYRELLYVLSERQIRVRYKQTVLGLAWILFQPLMQVLVLSFVFGKMARLDSGGVPYPLFVFSGIIVWTLFSQGVDRSSGSLVANERLVTKVYFPRVIIPLSSVGATIVDSLIAFVLLIIGLLCMGFSPMWQWLLAPLALAGSAVFAAATGLAFSGINARYRDLQYTTPFLLQAWMYASPVVYSNALVPEAFKPFYYLNPMAGLIELMRYALFGTPLTSPAGLWTGVAVIGAVGLVGVVLFRKAESDLADYL